MLFFFFAVHTSHSCDCRRPIYKYFSAIGPCLLLDNTGPTNRGGSLSPLGDLKSIVSIYDGISCLPYDFGYELFPHYTVEEFK